MPRAEQSSAERVRLHTERSSAGRARPRSEQSSVDRVGLRAELITTVGEIELDLMLEVLPGRCLALAGPSGAGKTTILNMIAGTRTLARGRIECGEHVWFDSERSIRLEPERRRCGYVFQDYALFPHMSAWRNVAYGMTDVPRGERHERALELLDRLRMSHRRDQRPGTLSGGERQRVALARALAPRPQALLLDEPLSALDVRTRASASVELAAILREIEVPVIIVTHDFHEAAALGDEVGVIDRGSILQRGSASELAAEPASAFVADFTGAVVLTGTARQGGDGLTLVELDGGGELRAAAPAEGRVAVSVYPWEIVLQAHDSREDGSSAGLREEGLREEGSRGESSAMNRLVAEVRSVTVVGNRARIGLLAGQPLVAETTRASAEQLGLEPGTVVLATWKATATRMVAL